MRATPHHVDVHVGRQLKLRRIALGLSQERLAERLGLTFQQIQKYERGANRLGASRLFEAARALDVEVGFFFEALGVDPGQLAEDASGYLGDGRCALPRHRPETPELVRAFECIEDAELRRRVLEITRALAASGGGSRRGA